MENKFDTDEQLRNALRDFEAIPDSRSFDTILEKMDRKKKRRIFIIFFWTGLIALTGITVPLIFNAYGSTTTYGTSVPDIHTGSSTQHEAITAHPSVTDAYIQTTQASQASIENASSPKTTNPKAKSGTTVPQGNYTAAISSTTSSSSKDHSKQDVNPADKQDPGSGTNNSAMNNKKNSATISIKEAGTVPAATPEINREEEALNSSMPATVPVDLMYMTPLNPLLPVDSTQPDVTAYIKEGSYPALFISPEKKNTISFYLGAQVSPALNSFAFSKNPNINPAYTGSGTNFPDVYLKAKKDQSHLNVGLPFGIKAGVQINHKYEVFAGFGVQTFREEEKLYTYPTSTVQPNPTSSYVDPAIPSSAGRNRRFSYLYYSLEANRLFSCTKTISFKLGLGLCGNQLINSSYVIASQTSYDQRVPSRENVSPWLLVTKVKAGLIFNAYRRFQVHISPGVFYSTTSVFKRDYVIRQKPFGADVECLLLFRLFKIKRK